MTKTPTAAAFSLLCLFAGGADAATLASRAAAEPVSAAVVEKEISGKISAFQTEQGLLRIEGSDIEVLITSSTKFGPGLTKDGLKPGVVVKVTVAQRADGKMEASSIQVQS